MYTLLPWRAHLGIDGGIIVNVLPSGSGCVARATVDAALASVHL
jgi:hypothetical protein